MTDKRKMAHRRSDAPQHQNNSIRSTWICLILFTIFFACMIAGKTTDNTSIEAFGAGVGFTLLIITTHENLREDKK